MPFVSTYHYDGIPRFSYGLQNPNNAAAIIVSILPCLWGLYLYAKNRSLNGRAHLIFALEVALIDMLALTFSRGAIFAWVAAFAFFAIGLTRSVRRENGPSNRSTKLQPLLGRINHDELIFIALRLVLCCGIMGAVGVFGRFSLIAAGDASALNRLTVWRGALQLIAARPLLGWGKGSAGFEYMQWLQSPDVHTPYKGLVNSYLQLAAEYGLPTLLVVFWGVGLTVWVYLAAAKKLKACSCLLLGMASAVIAMAMAAIFTTTWLDWHVRIVILGLVAGAIPAIAQIGWPWIKTGLLYSFLLAATLCISGYGAGLTLARTSKWQLQYENPHVIALQPHNRLPHGASDLVLLTDYRSLGPYYGKTIRRLLNSLDVPPQHVLIVEPGGRVPPGTAPTYAFGSRADDISNRSPRTKRRVSNCSRDSLETKQLGVWRTMVSVQLGRRITQAVHVQCSEKPM